MRMSDCLVSHLFHLSKYCDLLPLPDLPQRAESPSFSLLAYFASQWISLSSAADPTHGILCGISRASSQPSVRPAPPVALRPSGDP